MKCVLFSNFRFGIFRLRRSCKISVILGFKVQFSLRCNRKTASFAVIPRKKVASCLNITEIWQLRRHEKTKRIAVYFISNQFLGAKIKEIPNYNQLIAA